MNAAADPILEVAHLSMRFGGLLAVADLSFSARRGEITALIGMMLWRPSGLMGRREIWQLWKRHE